MPSPPSPRRVVILGATGSIGESAAKVARALPERMKIVGISGHNNQQCLLELAREFQPRAISTKDEASANTLLEALASVMLTPTISYAEEGLLTLATLPEADLVLVAIVGTTGLKPALAALKAGKNLAVASKEILVMAGEEIMKTAAHHGCHILPVDSEHNALFQCLEGRDPATIRRLIITCSGGPFRTTAATELATVTPAMALCHPTWDMGPKITIDSATLFNKGLEMIEAHHLFHIPMEKIDVVVHPESIIHSMVEFVDGSILAHMSQNDMMFPIQCAVTYPDRVAGPCPFLDLPGIGALHFEAPRHDVFPALRLARQAGAIGGTMPAVLNAANEKAVELFLAGSIAFPDIWKYVEEAMELIPYILQPTLGEIITADQAARKVVLQLYKR
ncbi:MAG: 1-deoxy-D-xylulose-5-phosphate reductoisomerase [Chthoniobacterales bacterium]